MAGETVITVVGNLVDDPELRFTPSGAAVANFRIASTPRTFDRQTNEWKDGEALFLTCSVWRQAAENVAEVGHGGTRGGEPELGVVDEVADDGDDCLACHVKNSWVRRADRLLGVSRLGEPTDGVSGVAAACGRPGR